MSRRGRSLAQLRASVVQLQTVIAAEKAALRSAGSAVTDAPEDTVGLPSADMTAVNNASNQGAQGTFYGSVAITVVNREEPGAPEPDPYAQYRAYLLRLLPPLDAHAASYQGDGV